MKNIVLIMIGALVLWIVSVYFLFDGINQYKKEYVKPDTSIVIHNGKADTTITIKPLPDILK